MLNKSALLLSLSEQLLLEVDEIDRFSVHSRGAHASSFLVIREASGGGEGGDGEALLALEVWDSSFTSVGGLGSFWLTAVDKLGEEMNSCLLLLGAW